MGTHTPLEASVQNWHSVLSPQVPLVRAQIQGGGDMSAPTVKHDKAGKGGQIVENSTIHPSISLQVNVLSPPGRNVYPCGQNIKPNQKNCYNNGAVSLTI